MKRNYNLNDLAKGQTILHIANELKFPLSSLRGGRDYHWWGLNDSVAKSIASVSDAVSNWVIEEANRIKPSVTHKRRTLRWKSTCLYLLPNLRTIKVTKLSEFLKLAFANISYVNKRKTELWGWRNRKYNKYLDAQYKRLSRLRGAEDKLKACLSYTGNPALIRGNSVGRDYWNLAYFLIKHSLVFQVLHFNKVVTYPSHWYNHMEFDHVINCFSKVWKKLSKGDWSKVQVSRVWIDDKNPHSQEKIRPLGVPSLEDRVLGSMFSNLLEFYLHSSIKNNHAYQFRKGTGTAWKWLLSFGIKYPYIWEFDLRGCFNNIDHVALGAILRAVGVPRWLWISLLEMQKRSPRLPEDGNFRVEGGRFVKLDKGKTKSFCFVDQSNERGVAQGHSLSPLLSVLVIEHAVRSWLATRKGWPTKVLMYADDGLVFSTSPIPIESLKQFWSSWGLFVEDAKSGMVREDWKWVKPVKFLGLVYDPFLEKLQAWTRKGSRVVLDTNWYFTYRGDQLLSVSGGAFWREDSYADLGKFFASKRLALDRLTCIYLMNLIATLISPWSFVVSAPLLFNFGLMPWWGCLVGLGLLKLGFEHVWLVIPLSYIMDSIIKLDWTMYEDDVYKTQLTWRLVLWNGLLNQFIARLYNGSLANKVVPQDFTLQVIPGCFLWLLRNSWVPASRGWRKWLKVNYLSSSFSNKGEEHLAGSYLSTLSQWVEKDLGLRINIFNASTVSTHLLVGLLRNLRREGGMSRGPSPKGLDSKALERLAIKGYWSILPRWLGANDSFFPRVLGGHPYRSCEDIPLSSIDSSVPPFPERKPVVLRQRMVGSLLKKADYVTLVGSWQSRFGTRVRSYVDFVTGMEWIGSRLYKTYRPMWNALILDIPLYSGRVNWVANQIKIPTLSNHGHLKVKTAIVKRYGRFAVYGWLPLVRTPRNTGLERIVSLNHKYVTTVHNKGKMYVCPATKGIFGRLQLGRRFRRVNKKI